MLSRRDLEGLPDLLPELDNIIKKTLGKLEPSVSAILERGLSSGYSRQKYIDKLEKIIESRRAEKLVDRLEVILDDYKDSQKSKKRSYDDENGDREVKKSRKEAESEVPASPASTVPLESHQIKQVMENAQKEIQERKRKFEGPPSLPPSSGVLSIASAGGAPLTAANEKIRKIAELQKQIQAKLQGTGLLLNNPALALPKPVVDKPRPLILDEEGRTVDTSGREINIQTLTPTLKANIRAKKKETFKHQQTEKVIEEAKNQEPSFFDDRIMVKPAIRTKRSLRFHEPGKFMQIGERMRMKAQLEKLQNEISQIARKTGISSATKLALIAPKTDIHSDEVPAMEWWDSVILDSDMNKMINGKISIREQAITNLIEVST